MGLRDRFPDLAFSAALLLTLVDQGRELSSEDYPATKLRQGSIRVRPSLMQVCFREIIFASEMRTFG